MAPVQERSPKVKLARKASGKSYEASLEIIVR